jgi:hypothetical protein
MITGSWFPLAYLLVPGGLESHDFTVLCVAPAALQEEGVAIMNSIEWQLQMPLVCTCSLWSSR